MCLGYPARVVDVDQAMAAATVVDRGIRRPASTLMVEDVAVGDWVLVAAGNVIRRLDPEDAASLAAEIARAERIRGTTAVAAGANPSSSPSRRPFGETL